MPKIKTKTDESGTVRVVTKDGKPSCTCCGGCVCSEDLADTYTITINYEHGGSVSRVVTREAPCDWRNTEDFDNAILRCTAQWEVNWIHGPSEAGPYYQDAPTPLSPLGTYAGGQIVVTTP